jgi:hypothetical protein
MPALRTRGAALGLEGFGAWWRLWDAGRVVCGSVGVGAIGVEMPDGADARLKARIPRAAASTAVLTDAGSWVGARAQFDRVEARFRPPTALRSIRASFWALTPRIFATSCRLKPWRRPLPVRRISTSVCRGVSDERQPFS